MMDLKVKFFDSLVLNLESINKSFGGKLRAWSRELRAIQYYKLILLKFYAQLAARSPKLMASLQRSLYFLFLKCFNHIAHFYIMIIFNGKTTFHPC